MAQTHAGNLPNITAEFNGTPVTIIERDGQRWLTADQIGLALGYSPANARTGITNLYGRHTDEFSSGDTCAIKLMAQGQMRETRIFSATGCIKLGFFASTPKAKEFRTWASEVLAGQPCQDLAEAPATAPQGEATLSGLYGQMQTLYQQLGERDSQIIGMLQLQQHSMTALNLELRGQVSKLSRQVERLSGKVITTQGQLIRAQKHVTTLVEGRMDGAQASATIVQMHRDGHSNAQIVAATGRNHNHVRQKLFQARRDGVLPPLEKDASAQTGLFAEAA